VVTLRGYMLKRLFVGIFIGVLMGGLAAAALIKGLGVLSFATATMGTGLAYIAALAVGACIALIAGKPIWAKGAWIEVGLKAFFGSLLAAGGMFALRRWGGMPVDLSHFGLGEGTLGTLPATSLPIIATALSVIFEVDNTDPPEADDKATAKPAAASPKRVASGNSTKEGLRVATEEREEEEAAVPNKKLRK
jgi:hypothetical protein